MREGKEEDAGPSSSFEWRHNENRQMPCHCKPPGGTEPYYAAFLSLTTKHTLVGCLLALHVLSLQVWGIASVVPRSFMTDSKHYHNSILVLCLNIIVDFASNVPSARNILNMLNIVFDRSSLPVHTLRSILVVFAGRRRVSCLKTLRYALRSEGFHWQPSRAHPSTSLSSGSILAE